MARYGIFVDLKRCIGCYSCVVGCKNWHMLNNAEGDPIKILDFTIGKFPTVERWIIPIMCLHCDNAPCINVCKTGALYKSKEGMVLFDENKCMGSKKCEKACPFGIIMFDLDKNKIFKCDLCMERIKKGLNPFCVDICPTNALWFGEIDDILKQKSPCFRIKTELNGNLFYSLTDRKLIKKLEELI